MKKRDLWWTNDSDIPEEVSGVVRSTGGAIGRACGNADRAEAGSAATEASLRVMVYAGARDLGAVNRSQYQ